MPPLPPPPPPPPRPLTTCAETGIAVVVLGQMQQQWLDKFSYINLSEWRRCDRLAGHVVWVYVGDWVARVGSEAEDYALRRRNLYDDYHYWPKKGGTLSRKAPLSFHDVYEKHKKRMELERWVGGRGENNTQ